MCTVSWVARAREYHVLFNRDEKRLRLPGRPPQTGHVRSIAFLAPHDGEHGGTWLGVNEWGVTVGLLNHYPLPAPREPRAPVSRGILVRELLVSHSAAGVAHRLERGDLAAFRPFTVLALDRTGAVVSVVWNRQAAPRSRGESPHGMLTTSSFDTTRTVRERRVLFEQWCERRGPPAPDWLELFHRSHEPSRGSHSVCMHRGDARTVSFSRLHVSRDGADFFYHPDSPCLAASDVRASLALRPEAAA